MVILGNPSPLHFFKIMRVQNVAMNIGGFKERARALSKCDPSLPAFLDKRPS